MDTFLPKDSTNESISTLREQKQPKILSLKQTIIPTLTPFNTIINKKQRINPIAPPRKVKIIRRKKTHNGHYCHQCRIYYQGYNHRCLTSKNADSSPTTSEGGGWVNFNPMIIKPKFKSPMPKEFDSWPKLDPKGK